MSLARQIVHGGEEVIKIVYCFIHNRYSRGLGATLMRGHFDINLDSLEYERISVHIKGRIQGQGVKPNLAGDMKR